MEEDKIKVPVYEGMAKILEVVNASYLCKMMGVSNTWLSGKQSKRIDVRGFQYSYSREDVNMINESLPRLASVILHSCLIPKEIYEDDLALAIHLKAFVKPVIILKYLVLKRMGRTDRWLESRTYIPKNPSRRRSKLSPNDAEDFNNAMKEIILYLRGIELEYEPPK